MKCDCVKFGQCFLHFLLFWCFFFSPKLCWSDKFFWNYKFCIKQPILRKRNKNIFTSRDPSFLFSILAKLEVWHSIAFLKECFPILQCQHEADGPSLTWQNGYVQEFSNVFFINSLSSKAKHLKGLVPTYSHEVFYESN